MCLISHSQAVGGSQHHRAARDQRRPEVRSCADPGVLFANAGPGTAVYGNRIQGNFIAGNELSGVTFHAHTLPPGKFEYLSGNKVIGNSIGTNNTGGDPLDCPPNSTTCSPRT